MSRNVLLIEDSATLAYLVEQALAKVDITVDVFDNGLNVVERALALLPRVVIVNKVLPGVNGYEVIRMLRTNEQTSNIPIMMLTDADSKNDVERGITQGADDYLLKPFESRELARRVIRLLNA